MHLSRLIAFQRSQLRTWAVQALKACQPSFNSLSETASIVKPLAVRKGVVTAPHLGRRKVPSNAGMKLAPLRFRGCMPCGSTILRLQHLHLLLHSLLPASAAHLHQASLASHPWLNYILGLLIAIPHMQPHGKPDAIHQPSSDRSLSSQGLSWVCMQAMIEPEQS